MTLKAVLFDMDGTIYDSGLDWKAIREEMGMPRDGRSISDQLATSSPDVRERGLQILHRVESEGAANGVLIGGAEEVLTMLRAHGIQCALITNNSRASLDAVMAKHPLPFDLFLTREDGPMKPAPELFLQALDAFGVEPADALAIGDAHLDAVAACRAGLSGMILVASPPWMEALIPDDVPYQSAADLHEVRGLLQKRLAEGPI